MRFLITGDFFKNVPKEKIKRVKERIQYFYREISENKKMIFDIPKGFWVKKLRENLYEFRVNSGDRVLFEFKDIKRTGYGEKVLVLLLFSTHDLAIKSGMRQNKIENLKVKKLEIEKSYENLDERSEEDLDIIYNKINSKIVYEITSDENLLEFIQNEDEYTYYYLNDEQYEILNSDFPLFLKGSAGSGKTTVAIRKSMELEERQDLKVGYITFTQSLKEKAYEMYEKFRNPNCEKMVEFYSLEELYEKQLRERPIGLKIFEFFIYEHNPTMPKGMENLELYQEIRGTIKGSMGAKGAGNWDRDLRQELIPQKDYLALNKKYTVYSEEVRKEIYRIALIYQEWLTERVYLDENDLARRVILSNKEIFDCIICDEVQDLTEVEIYMLKTLVKNGKNLLLSGDIHQIINPTYFRFSRVKSLFYKVEYTEKQLGKNYRSQKKIVNLANELSDLRGEYIGKLGEDYKEASILEGEDVYIYKKDNNFLNKLEENTTIILVPTYQIKEMLRVELPKIANKILTVQDIKGLEFDSVVLYNFATELKKYWEIIFSGGAKKNQLYRYYFNLLYVGLTRARKRLLFMEEEKDICLLGKLRNHLVPLTVEGARDFTLKSGESDFLKEGKEFLNRKLFVEAIAAFEKAGAEKYIKKAKDELAADKFFIEYNEKKTIEYIINNDDSLSNCLEKHVVIDKIGDYAFEKKYYEKAKKYYEKSGNYERLSKLFEMDGDLEKSLEYAVKSEINPLIVRVKQELEKNDIALEIANEVRVLSDKKINSKKISLVEFENLDKKYIIKKQQKNIGDILVILNDRFKFKSKGLKKHSVKSPTKLLIKLYHIDGGKNGINYLMENYSKQLNIKIIVSLLDDGNIIEKYISKSKRKPELDQLLLLACEHKKIKNTKKLLQLGGDIEVKSEDGLTPLMMAIKNKDLEMVKLLVSSDAELGEILDKKNKFKVTPLIYSIIENEFDIFKYLIDKDVDVDLQNPIYHGVVHRNKPVIKALLDKNVKLDIEVEGMTPLLLATLSKDLEIMKMLIEKGANLDYTVGASTPMIKIIQNNYLEGMRLFLEKGYRLKEDDLAALSLKGNIELSKLVLIDNLGYNYIERIEQNISHIKNNRNKEKKVESFKKIKKKYDFEGYRKITEEEE
ncbi:ankyrin repeat domain-containing protein [Psychrilyobacter sp.]|uniref:ankyrin repeat domain-containing protein n=1 Tax=Psychrilyobacter sp. TaxID=2586924 RepID=UPI00301ACA0F